MWVSVYVSVCGCVSVRVSVSGQCAVRLYITLCFRVCVCQFVSLCIFQCVSVCMMMSVCVCVSVPVGACHCVTVYDGVYVSLCVKPYVCHGVLVSVWSVCQYVS